MSPFVHLKIGQQVWNSGACHHGGKEPRWGGQFMEIATNMFQHHVHIVVKDQAHPLQVIGEANVPLNVFTQNGAREEAVTLNTGGWIRLRSEFVGGFNPVAQVAQVVV